MFVGPSYELKTRKASVQRAVNLMPTLVESGTGKSTYYLAPIPGLRIFSTPFLCTPYAEPELFGSGTHCIYVESTNEVWSIWRSDSGGGRPIGLPAGDPSLTGTYVLIYGADTLAWKTSIRLGGTEPSTWLIFLTYRDGFAYASLSSNRLLESAFYPDVTPLVVKINVSTRAIVGTSAGNSAISAFVKFGLISQDTSGLYMSNVEGTNGGTSHMAETPSFAFTGSETATHPMAEWAYNPQTDVRAYAGIGPLDGNVDLRGGFVGSITLNSHVAGMGSSNLGHRLVARTRGPQIYVLSIEHAGLLAINTSSGAVTVLSSTFIGRSMYYSPDSDRLWIDGKESILSAPVVREYSCSTNALLATHTDRSISLGAQNGNSAYIGCESFVACESGATENSRMWRVGFPHLVTP